MFTIRKKDGSSVGIGLDDLRGEKREDGRFHVKLKDGSEGIVLRKAELDEIEAERQREIKAALDVLDATKLDTDLRPGLQRLAEDWNK